MLLGMEKIFRYILITISIVAAFQLFAQDSLKLKIVDEISTFDIDAEGNYFVADNAFTLFKYSPKGELITNVNIKSYGKISSIDCSNSFEIYVFHQDQNIIVFYDNMLNLRGELRLNDIYLNNVTCIARSFDNNIWIVDLSQYKLLKINKKGEILYESQYLNNVLGQDLDTYKIWESNKKVFLADSSNGIYQFDLYATHSTTYYIPNCNEAIGLGKSLFVIQGNRLIEYNMLSRDILTLPYRIKQKSPLSIFKNKLFFKYKNVFVSIGI